MKTYYKERTLQWICDQYDKGDISFSHKLQRPVGCWNSKMRSLLIHSLLVGFPVNTIYVVDEDGTLYTLDGSQRTSTCIDYVNNKFALNKNIPNVVIANKENGQRSKLTKAQFIKRVKKIYKQEFKYLNLDDIKDFHSKVILEIQCPVCGKVFKHTPNNHLRKTGCPFCNDTTISFNILCYSSQSLSAQRMSKMSYTFIWRT